MLYPAELRARMGDFNEITLTQYGAGNETRTRDIHVGNVVLYQLSYSRMVLQEGLEPSRLYRQRILSPLCLPIPPPERACAYTRARRISRSGRVTS